MIATPWGEKRKKGGRKGEWEPGETEDLQRPKIGIPGDKGKNGNLAWDP